MKCEKCNKEVVEGNFVVVPCHKQTPQGIVASVMHIILCDVCCQGINTKIVGSAKVVDAEIVTELKENI